MIKKTKDLKPKEWQITACIEDSFSSDKEECKKILKMFENMLEEQQAGLDLMKRYLTIVKRVI